MAGWPLGIYHVLTSWHDWPAGNAWLCQPAFRNLDYYILGKTGWVAGWLGDLLELDNYLISGMAGWLAGCPSEV